MDLLDELGTQLRALTADQPAQPGDRVPGVTRRARGIRRTRMAVAAAAALAVVTPAALVISSGNHHEATQYADLSEWPDRSVQAYAGIGDAVLAAITSSSGDVATDVHWLYRARVELPDRTPAYVAVLTAGLEGRLTLVTATSVGNELDEHGYAESSRDLTWDTSDRVVLDPGAPFSHVGTYLTYTRDDSVAAFAVVLGSPRDHTLEWAEQPVAFAPSRGADAASVSSRNGVFLADLGEVTGLVTVALEGRSSVPLASGSSVPTLARADAPDVPTGWDEKAGGSGTTSDSGNGRWNMASYGLAGGDLDTPMTILVRCYGGGTLTVVLAEGVGRRPQGQGTVPCDDETHQALTSVDPHGLASVIELHGDRMQAVTFSFGSVG
jgi:hypothetical protein